MSHFPGFYTPEKDKFFKSMREALVSAKFALEQELSNIEKSLAFERIRDALDLLGEMESKMNRHGEILGPGNDQNTQIVDTLSHSLANPFGSPDEQPTNVDLKKRPK